MADCVDTAMQRMESTTFESAVDRARPHSHRRDLPARDDAVLALRERRDLTIHGVRLRFAPHSGVNCNLAGHGPRMTPKR